MSTRRKQSTKDLGELLNQTVPVLDEEEPQPLVDTEQSSSPDAESLHTTNESAHEHSPVVVDGSTASIQANDVGSEEDSKSTSPAISEALSESLESGTIAEIANDNATVKPSSDSAMIDEDGTPEEEQVESLDQPALDTDLRFVDAIDTEHSEDPDKRPSDASGDELPEPIIEPITWRKSTIPFREDQYDEIGRLLAEFRAEHGVQLTIAEFVRLGLDKQIQAFQDEATRSDLLAELHDQQQRESQGNQNLKHSRSHGLGQYLAQP